MDKYKIPNHVVTYKPGTARKSKDRALTHCQKLYYGKPGEELHVLLWARWPSYDFIFAVPTKKNRFYKDERAYFCYRNSKTKKSKCAFYVDSWELRNLADGFNKLLKAARNR